MKLTRQQVVAARGLLEWTQDDLANAAGLSRITVHGFESGSRLVNEESEARIVLSLQQRGIEFTNGDSPGVRYNPAKAILPRKLD
jgi:DNA-binding XRE family transcriptional regulator